MVKYFVGETLIDDPEGIPVIDADGQEICVLPDEFDYLGRPEADTMHFIPTDLEERIGD